MPLKNLLQLVLLASLWGASFLFMRIATPEFGAISLIAIRVSIASLFLLPIWWFREGRQSLPTIRSNVVHLFVVGAFNSAIPFVLFAYSTLFITGGFSSILNSTAPIWAALIAYFWLGKKLSLDAILGLVLGTFGVAVLVSGSIGDAFAGASIGIGAALSATLMYGVAANYTSAKLSDVSTLTIATLSLVAAALILIIPALLSLPEQPVSGKAWLAVTAMGLLSTGLANILYFNLIAEVGSTRAITVTFLIPIFGTFFGAVFLSEEVTLTMIIGTGVILTGTALVTGVLGFAKKPH